MEQKKFDLFEAAGKKNEKPIPKAAPTGHPFGLEEVKLENFDPSIMTVTDAQNMITKVRQLHDEIDRKLDDIFQKSGWSIKQIQSYLENPNNFSQEEWERVQKERKRLLNSIKTDKELAEAPVNEGKSATAESSKERRGKMIGARRNWIPMR